eukprot:CAMPEP_0170619382 /NCGR_PEP_ID=MMETSP0224-20130122/27486_1 /TAXON_ID=285029 /ORGANISM="Togula jolla, Strain CCCM 725" /LENGTH=437 /DNA_ID=CAMNT_0010945467 /DNA_START=59 /DNA_END=1373 /DNA_ORIENTATION=+
MIWLVPMVLARAVCMAAGTFSYFSVPRKEIPSQACVAEKLSALGPRGEVNRGSIPQLRGSASSLRNDGRRSSAPTQGSLAFSKQVEEFLPLIIPTSEAVQIAQDVASCTQRLIQTVVPEARVEGFANGSFFRGSAFAVAVPEVEIIVCVDPGVLLHRLQDKLTHNQGPTGGDMRMVQKTALRVFTELLVSQGNFKFRRSAFRCAEPKVTLMASIESRLCSKAIPIDFAVNCMVPLHNVCLLEACGEVFPQSKVLALLVKRWAKDRGVCHAPSGHLAPYAWTLMALYFLQVGATDEAMLPPLQGVKAHDSFAVRWGAALPEGAKQPLDKTGQGRAPVHAGELFRGFLCFYAYEMDWAKEVVAVRLGRRTPPSLTQSSQRQAVACIEDPFEPSRNIGAGVTPEGLARTQEELVRALALLDRGAPLAQLLDPWMQWSNSL